VVRESVSGEMIKPAGSSAFIVVQKGSGRPLTWGIFLWLGDIFLIRNLDQLTTAAPYAGFGGAAPLALCQIQRRQFAISRSLSKRVRVTAVTERPSKE
jgi:hypothetical protein